MLLERNNLIGKLFNNCFFIYLFFIYIITITIIYFIWYILELFLPEAQKVLVEKYTKLRIADVVGKLF